MTTMLWLPGARVVNFGTNGGTFTDTTHPKGVLHTTEGGSWPTYQAGQVAPHLTVLPTPGKGVEVHQHVAFNLASRALVNAAGGVQTNRDFAIQVELIGTCAKGGPGYYWPDADDAVLADLYRKVIAPLSVAFSIPLKAPRWLPYPSSYGPSAVRFTGAQWDNYAGWCGHQHVPENDHGDPGAFPWSRLIAAGAGTSTTTPEEDPLAGFTETDLEHAAGVGVHGQQIGRNVLEDGKTPLTFGIAAERTYKGVQAMSVQVAALTAAVKALAAERGLDPDATIAAVKEAVTESMAGVKITLEVPQ